jgi:Protein of unknown function (DUF3141)
MGAVSPNAADVGSAAAPFNLAGDVTDYWVDAAQRWALFLEVLARRGAEYREHAAKSAPHVLKFECSLIMDGRTLPRPVNYGLVRITPPSNVKVNQTRRPYVVCATPPASPCSTAFMARPFFRLSSGSGRRIEVCSASLPRTRPGQPGSIAGSPLAYWAGVHGKNPMRYTGGLLGGTWLTALIGDLGNGTFDGATHTRAD